MRFALLLIWVSLLEAQVSIRFTPESMAVPSSVIASARDMGRYKLVACNDGSVPINLPFERIDLAAGKLRLIDPEDALLVLMGHQKRSFWSRLGQYSGLGAEGAAFGLGIANGKANAAWVLGLTVASIALPQIGKAAAGEVPSIAPLESKVKYPYALAPGGCLTDHVFAGKMKNPQIVETKIELTDLLRLPINGFEVVHAQQD